MELLKQSVELLPDTNSDKRNFHNEIAFIKYSVVVHLIFIARQLNKNDHLVITTENRMSDSIS